MMSLHQIAKLFPMPVEFDQIITGMGEEEGEPVLQITILKDKQIIYFSQYLASDLEVSKHDG
jgi:hypothetical protein